MSYGNSNRPSPSQFSSGSYLSDDQPPQRSNNTLWWVLGILGVLGIGTVVVCCGGGYMAFRWAATEVAQLMKPQIENDVAIREHIGEIESMSVNFTATQAHQDDQIMIVDISGSKGSGHLEIQNYDEEGTTCVLVMADGQRYDVVLEQEDDWSDEDLMDGLETDETESEDTESEAETTDSMIPDESAASQDDPNQTKLETDTATVPSL